MDRLAIERHGVPGFELMQRAGRAAFAALTARWPQARRLVVFCGSGNNAGDGYVLARHAADAGLDVEIRTLTPAARLRGDAALAWAECRDANLAIVPFESTSLREPLVADVVVDALLGTGTDRDLDGSFAAAVAQINAAATPVLALDIPSGLHADSGQVMGVAVHATATISFVAPKTGLFLGLAPDFCGDLEISDLDLPAAVAAGFEAPLVTLTDDALLRALPRRARVAHKGDHGTLLLIGGGPSMPGAIRLAAEAALRTGAGLVHVATHPDNADAITSGRPEIICHRIGTPDQLHELCERADGLVLGPGLGQSPWAQALWSQAIAIDLPLVVDADALNLLAGRPTVRSAWVLTPHPGEAARLLGMTAAAVNSDRLAAVVELGRRYGATAVLKGAHSLVSCTAQGEPTALCLAGNPGMASAGMGDVLAGVIGGLLVQTRDIAVAAKAGVLLHALAGDAAARAGERGLLASDLLPFLRTLANPQ